jgi:hypothetical protein
MECPICYTNAPTYVINCGSTVEHTVCDTCEVTMRMKEPATREGRVLKCPMCRVPEKVPGKRTSFSYEYELSMLYAAPVRAPAPVRAVQVRNIDNEWRDLAETIRQMSPEMQLQYIRRFPQLQPYLDIYNPLEAVIDLVHQIDRIPRQRFAAQVAPANQAAMRPPRPVDYHSFCQSGNRETGVCRTRGKTERKCTYAGCTKFVCRSCRECLTH